MDQIRFKTGEFITFTATRTFALGNTGINLAKGSEFEFDGSTVKYAGADYAFPQLRAAYNTRWIVKTDEYEDSTNYNRPVSANIKVRSATEDGTTKEMKAPVATETDERVVMSSLDHSKDTKNHNAGIVEDQDGVPVGRTFQTRAKSKSSLTAETAGSTLRSADAVQIKPGAGRSESDMLDSMSESDRADYLARKESIKSRYVDTDSHQGTPVASVKTAAVKEAEGMKVTQSVGGGIETADMAGTGGKPKDSVRVEDGITFRNTNGPERDTEPSPRSEEAQQPVMVKDGTADIRRQIAQSLCPEFPATYDFSAPEKKKLARLQADFDDRPDVIRAVFAAESDTFKATLVSEFPTAFQG